MTACVGFADCPCDRCRIKRRDTLAACPDHDPRDASYCARCRTRAGNGCLCAWNTDGSLTRTLCPVHADTDPCLTMSLVTGRRRKGTIRRGVCTACGHGANRPEGVRS